jgi:ADP-ribose pyrophosphatase YjhB (NUDIX family)
MSVLLCKSVNSNEKWGFLKGVALPNELPEDTAMREFEEESSIKIEKKYLEKMFYQKNDLKDIGIYLVNYYNIKDINKYFDSEILYEKNLSSENSKIKFYNIKNMPQIKRKQIFLTNDILKYLRVLFEKA